MDKSNVSIQTLIRLRQTLQMLEEALQLLGNDMCGKFLEKLATLSEEEQQKFLDNFESNPYTAIAEAGVQMKIEYEAHKIDPLTIAKVEAMMAAAEFEDDFNLNEEDDNEGNGSLQ